MIYPGISRQISADSFLAQTYNINDQIALLNARHFGRSTEKLSELPGQMNCNIKAEKEAEAPYAEPTIEQVVPRKTKRSSQRKDDLSQLPKRVNANELTKEQLTEIYGENGWKRLPAEVYNWVECKPSVKQVVELHVAVYTDK